jgi:hypothetical protein
LISTPTFKKKNTQQQKNKNTGERYGFERKSKGKKSKVSQMAVRMK